MCFSLDYKTQRWKVIDGLQRMSSIIRFLSAADWQLSDLPDIHADLRRVKNNTLRHGNDKQRRLFSLVEDVSIPITLIRCDYSQQSHMRYLFTIFHRLNSGGVRLTNQEIRNCIYTGAFNDLIKNFDRQNADWQAVKKRIWGSMERFRSMEVVLRILAFGDRLATYDGNLARFLNDYMYAKSMETSDSLGDLEASLAKIASVARVVLKGEQQKKLPLVFVEGVLVALYVHRSRLGTTPVDHFNRAYKSVITNPTFSESAKYAVSGEANVKLRLNVAIEAFA
jgi:hypothetical protein